jgi:hypothetical protein
MKKAFKLFGVIALVAVIGFTMLACASIYGIAQKWKGIILNGEDSKLLEGNVYAMFTSDDTYYYTFPQTISFLPNGKADGFNFLLGKSTWERKGSNVKLVIQGGSALIEGIHNPESNTILGTITNSDDTKAEFKMIFLGIKGSNFDYSAEKFTIKSHGLMIMVEGDLYPIGDLTGYIGTNTNIRLPPKKDDTIITNIAARSFNNKNLTNVFFPRRSITSIEAQAFANNKLTVLILPDDIVSIGNQAFANNPLIYITIGANVNFLGIQFETDFDDTSSVPFGSNFEKTYIEGGRKAGTYTRPNVNSTTWTRE